MKYQMGEYVHTREAFINVDETATFQSSDSKNEVYYRVEITDLDQHQVWLTTPIRMTKSEIARKLATRFKDFTFVKETLNLHQKKPVLSLDTLMTGGETWLLNAIKPVVSKKKRTV